MLFERQFVFIRELRLGPIQIDLRHFQLELSPALVIFRAAGAGLQARQELAGLDLFTPFGRHRHDPTRDPEEKFLLDNGCNPAGELKLPDDFPALYSIGGFRRYDGRWDRRGRRRLDGWSAPASNRYREDNPERPPTPDSFQHNFFTPQ